MVPDLNSEHLKTVQALHEISKMPFLDRQKILRSISRDGQNYDDDMEALFEFQYFCGELVQLFISSV